MSPFRKAAIAVAMVGSTLTGGAIGAALFTGSSSNAATTSTTTPAASSGSSSSAPSAASPAPSGTFHPNENAAHEAGESAQREAQENAGQFPTVP
ncbi:MAG TPA: hypothetical protein VLL25_00845 [Acidimicrobiales bacterium]|nr:hypothetical protein [Acidimicrobiales bacterium]